MRCWRLLLLPALLAGLVSVRGEEGWEGCSSVRVGGAVPAGSRAGPWLTVSHKTGKQRSRPLGCPPPPSFFSFNSLEKYFCPLSTLELTRQSAIICGEYVVLAPVGPLVKGGPRRGFRVWGARLERSFHFRKESGVTAVPGHRVVTHQKACRHTTAFKK